MPKLVDSCGWIEYFVDGKNAQCFAEALEKVEELIVPTVVITEVYKWLLRNVGESEALTAIAVMKQGKVIDFNEFLAISAGELSHERKIPLADSMIYATALNEKAELLTQDNDLEGLENVQYFVHPNLK